MHAWEGVRVNEGTEASPALLGSCSDGSSLFHGWVRWLESPGSGEVG